MLFYQGKVGILISDVCGNHVLYPCSKISNISYLHLSFEDVLTAICTIATFLILGSLSLHSNYANRVNYGQLENVLKNIGLSVELFYV